MNEQDELLAAVQERLDLLYEARGKTARTFQKHQRLKDFCGIASNINVLVGFMVASGGMWIAATVFVGIGLVFRFGEIFHGRISCRAQGNMLYLDLMIIGARGELL